MGRADTLARLRHASEQRQFSWRAFWVAVDAALADADVTDSDTCAASGLSSASVARRKRLMREEGRL